jgi:TolB-like protein/DNA-binding winged helix-turn-helix (wHTH) protein
MVAKSSRLRIGDLSLDIGQGLLRRDSQRIALGPLTYRLLLTLVEAAPNVVSSEELIQSIWSGRPVSPETISQRIKLLRDALCDDPHNPRYVELVRGRGYRLVPPVEVLPDETEAVPILNSAASSGAVPWTTPWPRRTTVVMLAGLLVLAAGTTAYVYFPRTESEASSVPPAIRSLVVLPLVNLSGDQEQEYFADGMTDALTTDLAQIGGLRVISRTSAMHFKGSKETLPQIGRELQVDAAVEGTVTRAADRVRITAQLVEARSDQHLWAKSYERDLKDVLALQDQIAKDITEQIRGKLTRQERILLVQAHPVDPEAYDAYLRGSYWENQLNEAGYKKACDYFQKAIAIDPGYALAYVGIARCQDTFDKFRDFVIKALSLDPSLADAHTRLATIKLFSDWDWPGAEAENKQAIALNPNYAPAHLWYGTYLLTMGRLDEAMAEIELAHDLDPYDAFTTVRLGEVLYHARRYDEALRVLQRGSEMHPDAFGFYWDMADIYEQKKMFAEAVAAHQHELSLRKDPRVAALAEAYRQSGYRGYLLKQAEQAENPAYAAHIYAQLGDEPRAIAALEVAYNKREPGILFIRTAPELESIRSSPRFRELVRRIGFPPLPNGKN